MSVGLWLDHYGVGVGIASNHVSPEAVVSQVDGARKQSTVRAGQVRVDVDLPLPLPDLATLMGAKATITMRDADGHDRFVHGLVAEADVIALHMEGGQACVQVFFIRAHQNWGNRAYFPRTGAGAEPGLRLLETVRQFALERLAEASEEAACRQRHRARMVALAEQTQPALAG